MDRDQIMRVGHALLMASTASVALLAADISVAAAPLDPNSSSAVRRQGCGNAVFINLESAVDADIAEAVRNPRFRSPRLSLTNPCLPMLPASPPPPPPPPPPTGGSTCFPAGTPVLMADGSWKAIEAVRIGDLVRGGYGTVNEVVALDRPVLGNRALYRVNRAFYNTSEHMMWTGEDFGVFSKSDYVMADYGVPLPVIVDDSGREELMTYVGVHPDRVREIGLGDTLAYGDSGTRRIELLEETWSFPPETQLYALVLDGSHTMQIAGGYVVSGWARDDDFDYELWRARSATSVGRRPAKVLA